jgi:hypothetical protein
VATCGYPNDTFGNQTAEEQETLKEYAKNYTETSQNLTVDGKEGLYLGFLPKRKEFERIIGGAMDTFFDEYVH